MRSSGKRRPCTLLAGALALTLLPAGCFRDDTSTTGTTRDFAPRFDDPDFAFDGDLAIAEPPDPCGDVPASPECHSSSWGPDPGEQPLPLPGDVNVPIGTAPMGVRRESDGAIVLDKGVTGSYALLLPGCTDQGTGEPYDVLRWSIDWGATVPIGADLSVRARTSASPDWQSPLWASAPYTPSHHQPKIDLQAELRPNLTPGDPNGTVVNNHYLRVEVTLTASPQGASPRLAWMEIAWKCSNSVGGLRQGGRRGAAFRSAHPRR